MILTINDDFDLKKITDSGQCFRWTMIDDHCCRILHDDKCIYVTELGNGTYDFSCDETEYKEIWEDYFDFKLNYREVRGRIDFDKDPFLWKAAEAQEGIRILQQDPWEMLVTFIISQNKNIPAIRKSVFLLAEACGDKRMDTRGEVYYAFPKPEAVAALGDETLRACKLGYRAKYIHATAEAVLNQEIDLQELLEADEKRTTETLTSLFGVGIKVANCVSLFGLHHINAFPIDTWIKKVIDDQYPNGYPYEEYAPYNGIYQQYMFAYYRNDKAKEKD